MIIELNEQQTDELRVKIFKALSDPIRIQIIRYMRRMDKELTCGDISKVIEMSKSAGSYHFKVLREAGLITTRKIAREKYVSLNYDTFKKYVNNFLDSL
ncbi:transcriptional regulator, ArsR family [Lentilactobacillus parafarraginis F0439]|uniref:Transcriptional regulator, ArsR family n=1 Tax=Lentilactobacillus parafarraginis F0439 TaxID=797515 RepID=G9ZPE9_9LACO|nr:metalloregulator ArsR/SmtB family transcription factor [Lentilactobacillus parafarraginis]EHL98363.1 transcriptional regulator, ArsR family [Lentilactobacillus parafarraginis F0439]